MADPLPHLSLHAVTHAEMNAARRDCCSPTERLAGRAVELPWFESLRLQRPFAVTFEQVVESLRLIPGLDLEPDGSFFWVGQCELLTHHEAVDSAPVRWQIDGQFHEAAGRVLQVEVKGDCPAANFHVLLSALGAQDHPVLALLVREARYVDARDWFASGPLNKPTR